MPPFRPAAKQHQSSQQHARGLQGPPWRGIESLADAERENDRRVERLHSRAPVLAQMIARCAHDEQREQTVCARAQRLRLKKEITRVASDYVGPHEVVTISRRLMLVICTKRISGSSTISSDSG